MDALIGLHERMVISTPNEFTVLLPNFSLANKFDGNPSIDAISQEVMEQSVRNNLETIILSILQREPMCGYDVIKTISQKFHVFLSQGIVYPVLYDLKKHGLLKVKDMSMRSRVYAPVERSKKIIENKLNDFAKVQEYLLNSVGGVSRDDKYPLPLLVSNSKAYFDTNLEKEPIYRGAVLLRLPIRR
ncbi:MAG: PadR family transcriptional regulator [Methanocellales archaeon]|nr:PadR family transcriptional regulator [Methanocellales archaeon]